MTTEKMNIHQALAELKTIGTRIEKEIRGTEWVITNKHSNTQINGVALGTWCEGVKSQYSKVNDLIRRRDAIKRAVVNSNAVTKVEVAGVTYTVAEAIDRKNHGLHFLKALAEQMASDQRRAQLLAERENGTRLEERAEAFIKSQIGNTDTKGMTEEIKKRREEFITAQTTDIIDPVCVSVQIEKINDEVYNFATQVDAALSVSNALTYIEVSY